MFDKIPPLPFDVHFLYHNPCFIIHKLLDIINNKGRDTTINTRNTKKEKKRKVQTCKEQSDVVRNEESQETLSSKNKK